MPTRCLTVGEVWESIALVFAKPQPLGRRMRTSLRKRRRRVGLTNTSNEEERKVGMGPEEEAGARARKSDSPTCRSVFQQRSWPWSLWAVRSHRSRTAWSPRESSPGCWRVWRLMAEDMCKNWIMQSVSTQTSEWERRAYKHCLNTL